MIKNVYFFTICVPNNPTDFVIRLIQKNKLQTNLFELFFPSWNVWYKELGAMLVTSTNKHLLVMDFGIILSIIT